MKNHWVRLAIVGGALMVMLISFTACNTMHGAGEDIEATGEAVQDAAD